MTGANLQPCTDSKVSLGKNGHWYLNYPVDMIIVIIIISLVYEMLFIRTFKANLNVQSDSICAKVFIFFIIIFTFCKFRTLLL